MPYEYLEDIAIADIAFMAKEKTLGKLFHTCSAAVMNVMIEDLATIEPKIFKNFEDKNQKVDLLLFDFLQELIYFKDSECLLLRPQKITIAKTDQGYKIQATLAGETLDPDKHEQRVDVKAITLHQYRVEFKDNTWSAHVILDI